MQLNYLDTSELIKSCIRNDSGAQKELYNLFSSKMLSICHRYAKSKDDAEDIFQEGFLKVFENLNQVKNMDSVEWCMKRIFINEALKLYNKNKRISLFEDLSLIKPNQADGGAARQKPKFFEKDLLNMIKFGVHYYLRLRINVF